MLRATRRLGLSLLAVTFGACSPSPPAATRASGAWTAARPIPVPRFEAFAAVAGGRVYFIGGITGVFGDLRTAEPSRRVDVYDPAADRWEEGPPLPADAPKHHLTVAAAGGEIYVLGGFDGILGQRPNEPFRPIARAYVLRDGAWQRLADPPLARGGATAQAIGDAIYVTGGSPTEERPSYGDLDVFDRARGTWSKGPPLPTPREHLASCAIGGRFYVVGGWAGEGKTSRAELEVFDPETQRWTSLPPLAQAKGGLAAAAWGGECHVIGGEDWAAPFPGTFTGHHVFDPRTRAWREAPPMPTPRHGLGLAALNDALYAVGGGPSMGNSYTDVVEVYVP